jgi:iron only hydrogenase large subunit-like protein/uncharacterized Fe-S cluster-containing protein
MEGWVVSTNVARCRDCYRCVRACPVKAVRVQEGQAQVEPELCIACGTCVLACPQDAKVVRNDTDIIRQALQQGKTVVASVAPSAPAYFGMRVFTQMEQVLTALGFAAAGETAYGAEMVGHAHRDVVDQAHERWPLIASSCPVVVSLVEKYYPDIIPHLAPIVSPLIAHGRWLRQTYGDDVYIVFIGPCIAKKAEILEPSVAGVIDAALTFEELEAWMAAEGVEWPAWEEDDEPVTRSNARLFPVEGGLVGTADLDTDILTGHIVTTSGLEECEDVLCSIRSGNLNACLVELMACEGGCINGPAMADRDGVSLARQRIIQYASRRQPAPLPTRADWPDLARTFEDKQVARQEFTEEQIVDVLHLVDKYTPEDELNCGACGYPTCRDKAVATLRGMAEATMCVPYMRRRADSLRQVVMDVSPNAILIVDNELHVQEMSSSAERILQFHLPRVVGRPLKTILPVIDGFMHVRDTGNAIINQNIRIRDDLIVEQTIVPAPGQNLMVGILRDITERVQQQDQMDHLRDETLHRTQEVINKQMRVAHEIAQLLGETTAETKMMLARLARTLEGDENGK